MQLHELEVEVPERGSWIEEIKVEPNEDGSPRDDGT
jgi:hypothetical protein